MNSRFEDTQVLPLLLRRPDDSLSAAMHLLPSSTTPSLPSFVAHSAEVSPNNLAERDPEAIHTWIFRHPCNAHTVSRSILLLSLSLSLTHFLR